VKKLYTYLAVLSITLNLFAQAPQKMSYQCVVRNRRGAFIANQSVGIRISILQGSTSGNIVFQETYNPNPQTNAYGLVTIEIGGGIPISGTFSSINWASGTYYLKTETYLAGGTNYTIVGTSQLLSVPYALYAKTSETSSNAVTLTDDQTITGFKSFSQDLFIDGIIVGRGRRNSSFTNTAFGNDALIYNSNGAYNTAIGFSALYSNWRGEGNTAVGFETLDLNATGENNTAIGKEALYGNNGNDNTANGYWALYNNFSGNGNTANGFYALLNNILGNFNTAIGYHANVASKDLNNSTAIGYNAIVNASNSFVFGNNNVTGWGFGVTPGDAAIKVGTSTSNGNGATLTLSGVWTDASDISKKHDIENIKYGLTEIMKLRPVTYKLEGSNNQDIGFIAQEVKKIIPEIVYGEEGQLTMSYGQLTSVLIKAIQEQQKQIEELKTIIDTFIANQTK
jgi:hypothetical protein